jgi:hypothetical protein
MVQLQMWRIGVCMGVSRDADLAAPRLAPATAGASRQCGRAAAMDEPRPRWAGETSGLDVHCDLGEGPALFARRTPHRNLITLDGARARLHGAAFARSCHSTVHHAPGGQRRLYGEIPPNARGKHRQVWRVHHRS